MNNIDNLIEKLNKEQRGSFKYRGPTVSGGKQEC